MIRYVTLSELANENLYMERIECHRQMWSNGNRWDRYLYHSRFSSGLAFVCSNITVNYMMSDGTILVAHEGDVVYLPKDCNYSVSFVSENLSEPCVNMYLVNFTIKDVKGNDVYLSDKIEIYRNASSKLVISLASELSDACLFSSSLLKKHSLFMSLLDAFVSHIERNEEYYYPIRHGVSLLLKEWDRNEKISRYSEACGISERNFFAAFKRWCGKTPGDFRNELRINAAASLLISSLLPISVIAFQTGFEDPYYFSRVFKKYKGIAPAIYRKNRSFTYE